MTTHEAGSNPQQSEHSAVIDVEIGLAERLECQIELRASGRIRDLHVVCEDGMIILMGRSRTYHAKQLAQEAVLDFTDGYLVLANQIVVS